RNLARSAEQLRIRESIISAEPTDRLALRLDECKCRMLSHSIPKSLKFTINRPLTQGRFECERIEKDVDIFRKALDQLPAFRETRSPFEDHAIAICDSNDSKRFGNVVVLLDQRGSQSFSAEVLRSLEYRLLEIRMLAEPHLSAIP